jgi:hypothetical protein
VAIVAEPDCSLNNEGENRENGLVSLLIDNGARSFCFLVMTFGKPRDSQHTNLDNDRKMFGPPHDDLCFAFLFHDDCLLPTTSLYTLPPILHALCLHSG